MKTENTALRLQKVMKQRNLRQVDIITLALPFCEQFDVKLNKSDLSQYVAGKVEPGQDKLYILGRALNVNEAWLMGYDVPMERIDSFPAADVPEFTYWGTPSTLSSNSPDPSSGSSDKVVKNHVSLMETGATILRNLQFMKNALTNGSQGLYSIKGLAGLFKQAKVYAKKIGCSSDQVERIQQICKKVESLLFSLRPNSSISLESQTMLMDAISETVAIIGKGR